MKDANLKKAKLKLSVNAVAASRVGWRFRSNQRWPCCLGRLVFSDGDCPRARWLFTLFLVFTGVTACASPEATRTRGGGPGADVGNRTKNVRMHEGSLPYWNTPRLIEAEHPSLDPARHAAEFSRR
jgi:hypothetical protein